MINKVGTDTSPDWQNRENRDVEKSKKKENISKIFASVEDALQNMVRNLDSDYSQVSFRKAEMLEVEINNTRDKLRNLHLQDITKKEYSKKITSSLKKKQ